MRVVQAFLELDLAPAAAQRGFACAPCVRLLLLSHRVPLRSGGPLAAWRRSLLRLTGHSSAHWRLLGTVKKELAAAGAEFVGRGSFLRRWLRGILPLVLWMSTLVEACRVEWVQLRHETLSVSPGPLLGRWRMRVTTWCSGRSASRFVAMPVVHENLRLWYFDGVVSCWNAGTRHTVASQRCRAVHLQTCVSFQTRRGRLLRDTGMHESDHVEFGTVRVRICGHACGAREFASVVLRWCCFVLERRDTSHCCLPKVSCCPPANVSLLSNAPPADCYATQESATPAFRRPAEELEPARRFQVPDPTLWVAKGGHSWFPARTQHGHINHFCRVESFVPAGGRTESFPPPVQGH